MNYNLKFKYKKERRYWNVTIYADNEEQGIEKTKEFLKSKNNIEKAILEKIVYKYKTIYKFDLKENKKDEIIKFI